MSRPRTDPGIGYSHTEDHCDLCASQAGWACRKWEEHEEALKALISKRATSEGRNEEAEKALAKAEREAEKRAKFWRWVFGLVATGGFAPWVYKLLELIAKGG